MQLWEIIGVITKAQEASFRTEMTEISEKMKINQVKDLVNEFNKNSQIKENDDYLTKISFADTNKWTDTLKKELLEWDIPALITGAEKLSYVNNKWSTLVNIDDDGFLVSLFYINTENGDYKYIFNPNTQVVFKIKDTRIGKYVVHSIEELDYLQQGLDTRKPKSRFNTISIETNIVKVSELEYYEPDVSGFAQENTELMYYNSTLKQFYGLSLSEYVSQNKPRTINIDENEYILYDYENRIWANVKITSSSGAESWFVWIPRYSYLNSDTNTDIKFIKVNEEPETGYEIAATFKGNNRKGIWIGKYEPQKETVENITTGYAYYIPDLSQLNKDNIYIEFVDKSTKKFISEKKYTEIQNFENYIRENCWYDYENQIWANIKVVNDQGTENTDDDLESWWVWIPRYAYKNNGSETDVIFVDTENEPMDGNKLPSGYAVGSAFEGNNKTGIWISKYEPQSIEN